MSIVVVLSGRSRPPIQAAGFQNPWFHTTQWPLIAMSPVSKHMPGGSAGENPGALAENNHDFLGKPNRLAHLPCVGKSMSSIRNTKAL